MSLNPEPHEDRRDRAVAAADIVALALERDLLHMALPAAREAARSALLVLAEGPHRPAARELDLLRQVAASSPQHLAGRPVERTAMVRATLAVLDRLVLRLPTAPLGELPMGGGGRRLPPEARPRGAPAARGRLARPGEATGAAAWTSGGMPP